MKSPHKLLSEVNDLAFYLLESPLNFLEFDTLHGALSFGIPQENFQGVPRLLSEGFMEHDDRHYVITPLGELAYAMTNYWKSLTKENV